MEYLLQHRKILLAAICLCESVSHGRRRRDVRTVTPGSPLSLSAVGCASGVGGALTSRRSARTAAGGDDALTDRATRRSLAM